MNEVITLKGSPLFVRFENPEGDFRIMSVRRLDNGEEFTATGNIPDAGPTEEMELTGSWSDNPKYGPQFEVVHATVKIPVSAEGMIEYLRRRIKSCGPVIAKKLVDHFGPDVKDIFDNAPNRLTECPGVGEKVASNMSKSWYLESDPNVRAMGLFLATYGIGDLWTTKFLKWKGKEALSVLRKNPYASMEVSGIGFKKADVMAQKMGWPEQSPQRTEAAFTYVLEKSVEEGHVFLHHDELLTQVRKVAASFSGRKQTPLPEEDALQALTNALDRSRNTPNGRNDQNCLVKEIVTLDNVPHVVYYLRNLYNAEKNLSRRIGEIVTYVQEKPRNIEATLQRVQVDLDKPLSPQQYSAVINTFQNNMSVITGKPGTGKTTSTLAIIQTAHRLGWNVSCCAPTGRAAKRMAEVTGEPAMTIHRLLKWREGGPTHNQAIPLTGDLLLVDESSMLDLELMAYLLAAVPDYMSVVFIGDVDQLPAIGPGMVLRDLINSKRVCVTRLDKIFRQAEGSLIIQNAHRISNGERPHFPESKGIDSDSYFIEVPRADNDKGEETADVNYVRNLLPVLIKKICQTKKIREKSGLRTIDPIKDIQVLIPMKKGPAGSIEFNKVLQAALNPREGRKFKLQEFRIGDRVMQLKNNYEEDMMVFNGDIGYVLDFDDVNRVMVVDMDGREVRYTYRDTEQLTLAYASTIHKAQGSEFNIVILLLCGHHTMMLERNLIYTACTRPKQLVIWVAEKSSIRKAVKTVSVLNRNSVLHLRIRAEVPKSLVVEQGHLFDLPKAVGA